ncbi:hypothetical protein GQ53DRAFT_612491, partial [Thozetella sp. PMI_491]
PTCTTAVPDHYGHVPPDACNANYGFYPSWEWNLVFAIGFALTTLVHLVQAAFCWVIIMGALWETCCFALRTLGAHDQQNLDYVIFSTLLFLLAPLWINAFIYMVVARLTHFLVPERRLLRIQASWLAKLFVLADVVSFGIQAAGGSMLADSDGPNKVSTGQHIYMAGIGVQLVFVLVFISFGVAFVGQLAVLSRDDLVERRGKWLWPLVLSVFIVLVLIVIRIIFRLIEFSMGVSSSNPILQHEAYQLSLHAFLMLIALALLNAVHPGRVLQGPESSFPRGSWKGWRWKRGGKN